MIIFLNENYKINCCWSSKTKNTKNKEKFLNIMDVKEIEDYYKEMGNAKKKGTIIYFL